MAVAASQRSYLVAKQSRCSPTVTYRLWSFVDNAAAFFAASSAPAASAPRALIMPRDPVIHSNQPSAADSPFDVADEVDEAALAAVMRRVPLGAGVLAGAAVALLVLGYLLIYLLVFLPRGSVG